MHGIPAWTPARDGPTAVAAGLIAALAAAGCGAEGTGRDSPGGDEVTPVRESSLEVDRGGRADAARRAGPTRPAWNGAARLELVREIRGRSLAADSGERSRPAFTDIRDVAAGGGPSGGVLVLDGADARVTMLDSAGRTTRRVARRGAGPGELRSPDRVEPSPGGGVLVLERRPAAVHRWGPDGSYRGRRELTVGEVRPSDGGLSGLADWGARVGGLRAVRLISLDPGDPSASASAVHLADSAGRAGAPVVSWATPGTASRLPEVFGPRRSWTAIRSGDGAPGIAVARGDRYEVRSYDTAGSLRAVIRGAEEAVPVTAEMRETALDHFLDEAARAGAPPGTLTRLRERIPVASTLPVLGGLWHSGPDGRLWVGLVGRGRPGDPSPAVRAFDVFRSDLRYLGRVDAPPGFRLHRVRGTRLYGSWSDSLAVPGVRIYRLVEPRAAEGTEESRRRSGREREPTAAPTPPPPW